MWSIKHLENIEICKSDICSLNIRKDGSKYNVYIDYKGYNVAFILGMWNFDEELLERNVQYETNGKKGDFKSIHYILEYDNMKIFAESVYCFLNEHNIDGALNDAYKYA